MKKVLVMLREALLTLAAIGGAICIVMVVVGFAFNVSIVMFKTGSMGPTIPAGSVALVREIPASEINVGDVVTVDRPGQLPITHRVTSIMPGENEGQYLITLRGDANPTDDPAAYPVTTVRLVIASMPGLAYIVVWLSDPRVLGLITVAAAALVLWAFWPRGGVPQADTAMPVPAHRESSAGVSERRRGGESRPHARHSTGRHL